MRTSCSLIDSLHVEHDDGDLGLLERGRGAQRRVEVGALLQVHATTDAGRVDEPPQPAAEIDDLVDGVAGGAGELVDDDALLAGGLVQQRGLADVRAAEDRDAARAADLLLGDRRDIAAAPS